MEDEKMIIDTLSKLPEIRSSCHNDSYRIRSKEKRVGTLWTNKSLFRQKIRWVVSCDVDCLRWCHVYRNRLPIKNDLNERPAYTPWLASLYVEKVYRNQGIALQLINQLIVYAKSRQITTIYLRTENASAYYKKLGWILVETIETMNSPMYIFAYNIDDA